LTANQFFTAPIGADVTRVRLGREEHRHLARSARNRPGDCVWLFDGGGTRYYARVEKVGRESTELRIIRREEDRTAKTGLVLAQALVAAKKMEFILQKAAELGFTGFQPLETARSLRAPAERSDRKRERWARIVREAAKQSKGATTMAVHPVLGLKAFLAAAEGGAEKILLSEYGGRPFRDLLTERRDGPSRPVVVCVGPEGGWTRAEDRLLRESGFTAVSLGSRILKVETAALAAAAMVVHFWGA
jgi:16S rRNA (uracil1498-N3)-methyltransferase